MKRARKQQLIIAITVVALTAGCHSDREKYLAAASLSQGLAIAGTAKTFVTAAYEETGKWPSSNEEARLPPPASYAKDEVTDLTVSEGGVINVHFKSGGTLRLIPEASQPEIGIRWRCTTTKFEELAPFVPQCKPEG